MTSFTGRENSYLFHYELEWNAVRLVRLLIKMECINQDISFLDLSLVFGNLLHINDHVVVQLRYAEIVIENLVDLATMSFVEAQIGNGLVVELGFLL